MKKRNLRNIVGGAALALLGAVAGTGSAHAAEWVDEWRALAKQTGFEGHAKFAEMLAKPEAIKLAGDWQAFLGYSARSIIAQSNIPAELKPGLEVTRETAAKYPWLKDYLPAPSYDRLMSTDWFRWGKIRIVPTTPYTLSANRLAATRKAQAEGAAFSVNDKGELIDAKGGFGLIDSDALPFTKPKSGIELYWAFLAHGIANENLEFKPLALDACLPSNKVDRSYKLHLWWQKMHGRVDVAPLGAIKGEDDVIEAGSVIFLEPYDVAGLAASRRRFAAADKPDDFRAFVPSLKRTRILAGSDSQDPMAAGFEATWDEWRQTWMKPDVKNFDFKIVGEKLILAQPETGHAYNPAQSSGNPCEIDVIDLELRPVWVLEVTDKTGNYIYGKRRIYIDKEFWYAQYQEMYDQKGNLWRVIDDARDMIPEKGLWMWRNYVMWNLISNRYNRIEMTADWSILDRPMEGLFDVHVLRDLR